MTAGIFGQPLLGQVLLGLGLWDVLPGGLAGRAGSFGRTSVAVSVVVLVVGQSAVRPPAPVAA